MGFASAAIAVLSATPFACASFGAADSDADADASTAPYDVDAAAVDSAPNGCIRPDDAKDFFCRTFDEPSIAPPYGFDAIENTGQAEIAVVAAPERSGKALRITVDEGAFQRDFALVKGLMAPASRYSVSFDLYVVRSSLTYAALGALHFTGSSYAAFPGIAQYDSGKFLSRLAPKVTEIPIAKGRWYRVTVDSPFTNGALAAKILVDGNLAGGDARVDPLPSNLVAKLKLGAFFTGSQAGSMEMLIDDLVVIVR